MGRPASKATRVRVAGPLAQFAPMLKAKLRESGYTPLSTVNVMRLMAHLSRWLDASRLGVADLTSEQVERYMAVRRAEGRTSALLPRSVAPILGMLADAGVVVPQARRRRCQSRTGCWRPLSATCFASARWQHRPRRPMPPGLAVSWQASPATGWPA